MALAAFVVSHKVAPIEVRERFSVPAETGRKVLRRIVEKGLAAEAVLLSTCNRTELYLHLPSPACPPTVLRRLTRMLGLTDVEADRYVVRHYGRAAAEHLLRVAAGLESVVIGEAQIQGQVCGAFEQAAHPAARTAGPVLSRLFQTALHIGGRVRSETGLGTGSASVASMAVQAARRTFGTLDGRRVLVVGAGEMARLATACLLKERPDRIFIANRSAASAHDLASKASATAIELSAIDSVLPDVDVVITATSAPHAVVTAEQLRAAYELDGRERVVLDLAVPRDVEPEASEVPGVTLITTDDLGSEVERNLARRYAMVPAAERIVAEGTNEFWHWFAVRDVVPVIRTIRGQAEAVREREANRCLDRLGHLSPEDRRAVEELTRRLVNKLLHTPTVRLRDASVMPQREEYVSTARFLFDISSAPDAEEPKSEHEPTAARPVSSAA
jgi:glutamyl-tRNA reductase